MPIKLGQNFLTSKKIVDDIIKTAEIKPTDTILEVGPGRGILTEALIKSDGRVIAVEKDEKLAEFLEQKFADQKNLKIISGDVLKIKNSDLIKNLKLKIKNFKIVANIPYYITSRFLKNCLTGKIQPETMVLMLQKEVAERIVARDGKESILSISVKAYGQPKIIKKVPASYFSPKPKVDSAIIKISNISRAFFNERSERSRTSLIDEKEFFELVKKGFSSKRKMLKNNLGVQAETLEKCGLSGKVRAEKLSLEDWQRLCNQIYQ